MEEDKIMEWWKQYFKDLLEGENIENIYTKQRKSSENEITMKEVKEVLKKAKARKVPEHHLIPLHSAFEWW